MNHTLRFLFFALIVRPVLLVVLGLNVRHRARLATEGPAVLVANHNSHLDALTLMSLFPLRRLSKLRPVAAADYFFSKRWLKWFALKIIGIIPLQRDIKSRKRDPLAELSAAIQRGEILLLFPEGTRGEPEQLSEFKTGVAHLAKRHPDVTVTPVFMHGLGKALPRGEALLVPFFLDVFVGQPLVWSGNKAEFMEQLTCRMTELAAEGDFAPLAMNAVAAAWGLAEATLFFIVPDVALTWIAVKSGRAATWACLWALAGALIGGTLMYWWAARDLASAERMLVQIPAIDANMLGIVREQVETAGPRAIFVGPVMGQPYKIYAVYSGAAGLGLAMFLLVSVPARLIRFLFTAWATALISRYALDSWSLRSRRILLMICWTVFYVWYFARLG